MIMRNAVILVDRIESDGKLRYAIVEATVRRARILTALAAILAMNPLTRIASWGPMAYTIMGGLFVATFLTLPPLPALYARWNRVRITAEQTQSSAKVRSLEASYLRLAAE